MNKFIATGLLALCALAFTQQQASAWISHRFGIGFNWDISCGGNHLGCGLWHNGQPPGAQYYGGHGHGHHGHGHHGHGHHGHGHHGHGHHGHGHHGHGHHGGYYGHATAPYGYMPPAYAYEMPMYMPSYAQQMAPPAGPFQYSYNGR